MDEYISARRVFGPSTYYFKNYEYYHTTNLLLKSFGQIDTREFITFGKNYLPAEYFRYLMLMTLLDHLLTNKKIFAIRNVNKVMAEIFPLVLPVQEILFTYLAPENFVWSKFIAAYYKLDFETEKRITFRSLMNIQLTIPVISLYHLLKIIINPEDLKWIIENLSPIHNELAAIQPAETLLRCDRMKNYIKTMQRVSQKYEKYILSGDFEYAELKTIVDTYIGETHQMNFPQTE